MNKTLMAAGLAVTLGACSSSEKSDVAESATPDPFFAEYMTPLGVPPFNQIEVAHYKPALLRGMEEQSKETEAIMANPDAPTFEGTIAALGQSNELLTKVMYAFGGQSSVNATDEIQKLERGLYPPLSKHSDDINLNPQLFTRVKSVYGNQASFHLDKEQKKLLEEIYKSFVRGGANPLEDRQARLRELNEKISMLQLTFEQNILKETSDFQLVIDNREDLSGLSEGMIIKAAQTAQEDGLDGKWVFTLRSPSVMPFLQYAGGRDLREKIFKACTNRGNNNNESDNKEVVRQLVAARLEKARLMRYGDYATFVLEESMAENERNMCNLFDKIWPSTLAETKEELANTNAEIKKEGGNYEAEDWDWRYCSEKTKKAKYNLDKNEMRPCFKLEHVREDIFYVTNKLYGITFAEIKNIPKPDSNVLAFECKDKDGTYLDVLYIDFFTYPGKGGGAWCGGYRSQAYKDGKRVAPVVTTMFNFSKPAEGQPALLTADGTGTVFHELGHALRSLFCDVHYYGVSDASRDFVKLPSQVDEHWTVEPEVLEVYAEHYQIDEIIPQALVDKVIKGSKYRQGFATTEYLTASYLDMDYHVLKKIPADLDIEKFEAKVLNDRGLIRQTPSRYRSTYFGHTMEGGYTTSYYSYIQTGVLDRDAFQAYKETGDIFNPEVASRFRKYVLTPGGIDDAMDMYVNFRGKQPSIGPLLKNRGLK